MLKAMTILLLFQLAGETLSMLFQLPVPGPVIGMGLLFGALLMRDGLVEQLRDTAQTMLQHLSLLFIPAGVGVMLHFHRLETEWLPISLSLLLSTLLAILVTAWVLRSLLTER